MGFGWTVSDRIICSSWIYSFERFALWALSMP
jgi:hypothetical protein